MLRGKGFLGRTGKIALIFLFSAFPLAAQDFPVNGTAWLIMEQGQASFRHGQFGLALQQFHQALESEPVLPEAEFWIGRVYEEEGEYQLAERQYLKALEMQDALYIPSEVISIKYQLSELYLNSGQFGKYEELLLSLFQEEMENKGYSYRLEHTYVDVMAEEGLNKLFYLYRIEIHQSLQGLSDLGIFYYKQKRYNSALIMNLYAVLAQFSQALEILKEKWFGFEFPDTEEQLIELDEDYYYQSLEYINKRYNGVVYCLDIFPNYPEIMNYLNQTDFYRSLYYLGMSAYAAGYEDSAVEIFGYLRNRDEAGVWSRLGAEQFANPNIETEIPLY